MKHCKLLIDWSFLEMEFFYHLLEELEDKERSWLDKQSKLSLHFGRLVSVACIFLLTYLFTFVIPLIFGTILVQFYNYTDSNYDYLWAIALLIAMPLSIPLFTNWMDRRYCFSSIVVDLFETIIFVRASFRPVKSYFEIVGFIFYITLNTSLTFYAAANFVNEQKLINYVEAHETPTILVILAIHTLIYVILRILLLPIKSIEQRYTKCMREFLLWFIVLLIGFSYMIHKLMNSFSTIDMFYLLGALLVAFVRFITSYKDLRKIIVELKETASVFM
ncbi:hypothetical protein D3C81_1368490 [compost metagenome]